MKLKKIFQEFGYSKELTTGIEIEVDYNPSTNTVDDILHVWAIDYQECKIVSLINVLSNQLSGQLDDLVSSVDWRDIYRSEKKLHPFFESIANAIQLDNLNRFGIKNKTA